MKRLLGGITVAVLGIATILAVPFASVTAQANLNNFSISNYEINYELSRDENNNSVLKTKEVIVAEFPNYDQNRGIERMIPTQYDGHLTQLTINSVTGENGEQLKYTDAAESGLDYKQLRIGDANTYVQGTQVYVLEYTQKNVTRFFDTTNKDEWYWDTNGTQWKVPIDALSVSVKLDASIATNLEGSPVCYKGAEGSSATCQVTKNDDGTFTVNAEQLAPLQNITLAFGFTPGTFAQYQPTLFERFMQIWPIILLVTGILSGLLLIVFVAIFFRKYNRISELHTIPVQYLPPKNTSVSVAANVVSPLGSTFAAQLIDFAVRHYVSIVETKPKSTWTLAEYDIVILKDPAELLEEEREILTDMFDKLPVVGDRLSLSTLHNNLSYQRRIQDNSGKLTTLVEGRYALRYKSPVTSKFFYRWAIAIAVAGVFTLSIPFLILASILALLGAFIRPLTDIGLEIRRYLLGLDKYIKAAEVDRIKFFQAPDTAQKVGERVDINNPGQILKLYERVLPYAILFGHEKKWTKQLEQFYQTVQTSPDWYTGTTAFNAGMLAGAVSSFTSAASYSSPSSSSSGGSGGGGSSGGGGGGGGGGGW